MVGRTVALEAGMRLARDLFGEPLHEPGLADPRFAVQQHHLTLAFLDLLPALAEYRHFCCPSDKGCQPTPLGHHLEPGESHTFPQDVIGPQTLVFPWQWRHRLSLPAEIPLDQASRGGADDHRPWRGEILKPCRQRQSAPDRQWIVPATTTLADDDRSGMDANAHGAR